LYSIRKIKTRISRWVGFVAASETREKAYEFELKNVKETGLSKDLYYEWMIG
jgi:hypothetical protein